MTVDPAGLMPTFIDTLSLLECQTLSATLGVPDSIPFGDTTSPAGRPDASTETT